MKISFFCFLLFAIYGFKNLNPSWGDSSPSPLTEVQKEKGDRKIRVGIPLSLTGRYQAISKHVKNGYEIGFKHFEKEGGIKINTVDYQLEVIFEDDRSSKEGVGFATLNLIDTKKVQFLLGPYGSELSQVVSKIAEEKKIPLIQSQGAALELYDSAQNKLHYTFSPASSADDYFSSLLQLLADISVARGKDQKELKVAIFYLNDQGTLAVREGILQKMKELGIEPLDMHLIHKNFDDLTEKLKEVSKKNPDALIATLLPEGAKAFVQVLKKEKMNVPMVGLSHCDAAGLEQLSPDSDYLFCVSQWDRNMGYKDPYFKDSVNYSIEFENQFGYSPPYQATGATISVTLLVEALKQAGTLDIKNVREALQNIKMATLFGEIRFDEDKKRGKPMVLYQILNKKYQIIAPLEQSSASLIFPMPSWQERLLVKPIQ